MNLSAVLGLFLAAAIVWFGAIGPSARPGIFLDPHAILLVVGGTLAAALIGFPLKRLMRILDFFIMGVIFKRSQRESEIATMVVEIALYHRRGGHLDAVDLPEHAHPFFQEAKALLERGLKGDDLKAVLNDRIAFFRSAYLADAKMLLALSKFPPAFGLLGASAGMIAMMTNLSADGVDKIGGAMAVALVATFWGIAVANFFLLPLADSATRSVVEDTRKRRLIADGIMLLTANIDVRTLVERLAGQMALDERASFYEVVRAKHLVGSNRDQKPAA